MSHAEEIVALLREVRDALLVLGKSRRASAGRMHSASELWTLARAARALGVSKRTLGEFVASGRVRAVPWPGGRKRIPCEEVERIKGEGLPASVPRPPGKRKAQRPTTTRGELLAAIDAIDVESLR